ncbi:MAG: hypothetical protein PW789_17460 [Edaphobacter sp.]|uniref:hypothetical protein n=1 Tax=Edaphobacter sp. TaxID=1934404 RepID=UPI00239731FE|nr:hypothetical protein [Edaphobacter sp.]MDE1178365.1 hypothetical protein [Edaphobacter sp.]
MFSAQGEQGLVERIDEVLHDLSQPLTVLQCRLALGEMDGKPESMRAAISAALSECRRINRSVEAMREVLLASASGATHEAAMAVAAAR